MIKEPIQDALFDLEELTRQAVAATPWNGRCPLGYTTDYYTPVELDAALDRWRAQYGDFGSYPMSHMWHRALCDPPLILDEHELHLYNADGRCDLHLYGVASPGRDEASHDHVANPLARRDHGAGQLPDLPVALRRPQREDRGGGLA